MSLSQGYSEVQKNLRRGTSLVHDALNRAVPGELSGAATVLTTAAAGPSPLFMTKSLSAAAADFGYKDKDGNKAEKGLNLRERLDAKPRLSLADNIASAVIPAIICAILFFVTNPARISLLYASGLAMIYAAWVAICRACLLERHYAARLVSETALGDRNSVFSKLNGIKVHYKVERPADGKLQAAVHCFHGFGANTGSWDPVHRKLAHGLCAQVSTHDMPGFGLTERPDNDSHYGLDFNGKLGSQIMEKELHKAGGSVPEGQATSSGTKSDARADEEAPTERREDSTQLSSSTQGQQPRIPRILMGHSLGGACVAAEAILNPEAVDAIVLVAPAVMAYGFLRPANRENTGKVEWHGDGKTGSARYRASGADQAPVKSSRRPRDNAPLRLVIALSQALAGLASGLVTKLLQPVTVVTLRSAVRNRAFWERGLARAWFSKAGPSPDAVDLYRRPQLVRGWEKGLIRFAAARMSGGRSLVAVAKDAWNGDIKPTQAELLADAVEKHNIKVLIVHGENDSLVSASNSRRLAALLPGAQLELLPETGHVPHEERPEAFLNIVQTFLVDLRHEKRLE